MLQRVLATAAVLTLCGCGEGGTAGDADAGDATYEMDAAGDTTADPAVDPAMDPGDDPGTDGPEDPSIDATDDPGSDPATDPVPDPATDPTPDVTDVVADGRCPAMTASFTSVESWVICWMGTGTAVAFTLRYSSPTTACSFTNVTVTGGSLDPVSSATPIMIWSTTAPTSGFSGTVPAGGTASGSYLVNDSTLDSSAHDGTSVTVTVDLSYDTPYSTETLTVTSSATTHTCVY